MLLLPDTYGEKHMGTFMIIFGSLDTRLVGNGHDKTLLSTITNQCQPSQASECAGIEVRCGPWSLRA